MKRHPLTFALALLAFLLPLRAQDLPSIPPEEYSLSPDGRTLLHWKGQEAYLNMAIDPVLKWIDTIAPQATYYVDSLGQVAGQPFLQELILPFPLQHISSRAFYCPYLRQVLLNKGLRSMEQWAFVDGAFSEIRLPATLQHYEEGAIMGRYLETIEVEEGSPYLAKPHAATLPHGQPLRSPPSARRDSPHRAICLCHESLRNTSRDTRRGYECRARGVPKVYLPHHPRSPRYALPNGGDPLD